MDYSGFLTFAIVDGNGSMGYIKVTKSDPHQFAASHTGVVQHGEYQFLADISSGYE
jgi:hypothetical protein